MKLTPYFELNGTRYEFKRTRWLIAEREKIAEENSVSQEDKYNTLTTKRLLEDAQKLSEKVDELWENLCENPTPENRATYSMFKEMKDEAVEKYTNFISETNAVNSSYKNTINVLEKVAIKALAEQYFGKNEALAKQTWEQFVDTMESHDKVAEWLLAMAECLFGEDEEEDTGFLAQKRKMDEEKANNRKSALRKKR